MKEQKRQSESAFWPTLRGFILFLKIRLPVRPSTRCDTQELRFALAVPPDFFIVSGFLTAHLVYMRLTTVWPS